MTIQEERYMWWLAHAPMEAIAGMSNPYVPANDNGK